MHRLPSASHSRIGIALVLVAALTASHATAPAPAPAVKPPSDSVIGAVIALMQSGDAQQRGAFLARTLSASARTSDSARIDTLIARLHEQGAPYVALDNEYVGPHVFARLRSNRASRVLRLQISTDHAQPRQFWYHRRSRVACRDARQHAVAYRTPHR